jgi:hypothetical protein
MKVLQIGRIPALMVLCVGIAFSQNSTHDVDKAATRTGHPSIFRRPCRRVPYAETHQVSDGTWDKLRKLGLTAIFGNLGSTEHPSRKLPTVLK